MTAWARYVADFIACGGIYANVQNTAAHWLYGTRPEVLAQMSKVGIVYNPPGH